MYTDENIIIKYKGVQPNEQTDNQIKRLTEVLINEAPSESCIRTSIVNAGERGFTGLIRVNSTEGSFFTKARDETLLGLASKLVEKVRKQIQNWKSVRFHIPESEDKSYGGEKETRH
jgi:hypothetical protein